MQFINPTFGPSLLTSVPNSAGVIIVQLISNGSNPSPIYTKLHNAEQKNLSVLLIFPFCKLNLAFTQSFGYTSYGLLWIIMLDIYLKILQNNHLILDY